jgi:ATP-binding cassette subfamily B multidrug efflux pump
MTARAGSPGPSLGGLFRKNAWLYAGGAGLLAAQQLAMAKRDFLVRDAVDHVLGGSHDAGASAALWVLGASLGAAVVRVLSRVTMFSAGRNVEYDLRAELLRKLHELGPSFYRRVPTGDIMSRATNDLAQVRLLLGFGALNVVASTFAFASALSVMVSLSGRLTMVSLATLPALWIVTRRFSRTMFRANREAQEAVGAMSDRVLASLSGVRVVRSFALEEAEARAFEVQNRAYLDKNLRLARVRGALGPIMGSIASAGVVIVFWYGGWLVLQHELTPGAFVSFWMALLRLTWPMLAIGFVAAIVERGRAGWMRLRTVFDAEPDVVGGEVVPAHVRGAIEVRGLTFSHGERRVLDDVSFVIEAGRSLAVVGRTGSGKSTLAALLSRILPTPANTVFLDGVDVCDVPLAWLREAVGFAQQDAFLFSTSVLDNVGFALAPRARERRAELESAAEEAAVRAEIEGLPEGWDTVVGERGVQLSGGQRQRIALARALVREPAVLVLDDPLSAVDAKTEAHVLAAIERQKSRRTVVLVTHRIAAASRCDEVVVLDGGRLVERGTHAELLAQGGLYAAFAAEQQRQADMDHLGELDLAAAQGASA